MVAPTNKNGRELVSQPIFCYNECNEKPPGGSLGIRATFI